MISLYHMMHPQYTNQAPGGYGQGPPPPQGFGGPPSNIGQPPMQPPQMYNNGLNPQPNRPPGTYLPFPFVKHQDNSKIWNNL